MSGPKYALSPALLEHREGQLRSLYGAVLQKAQASTRDIVLGFWTDAGMQWLWVDLLKPKPYIALLKELPRTSLKERPPILAFLNAHLLGQALRETYVIKEYGRILSLSFAHDENPLQIEVCLIPGHPNLGVRAYKKEIWWAKPHPYEPFEWKDQPISKKEVEELDQAWSARFQQKVVDSTQKNDVEHLFKKQIQKQERAIIKVRADLESKKNKPFREIAQWITSRQSLEVPPEWV
ncbi:MAG: hypothetical protein KDD22_06230, partial [Bdellovibrionales bacterium]|nr:hypothetical protein [Bdellovibrionales bacterium]